MEWISVKEKLPEHGKHVLCHVKANYTGGNFCVVLFQRNGIWDNYNSVVTHWMSLPELPKD